MKDNDGPVARAIRAKLTEHFAPLHLELINESYLHIGHIGVPVGAQGESHFRLTIIAAQFVGLSRLERQRAIMEVLRAELKNDVHALIIRARAPDEDIL